MKSNAWSRGLLVTADGTGFVSHVGSVALRMLADQVGLTDTVSKALARRSFTPIHDRGGSWSMSRCSSLMAVRRSPTSTCSVTEASCSGRWRPRRRCGERWMS